METTVPAVEIPGDRMAGADLVVRRWALHGLTAAVVAPRDPFAPLLSLSLAAYPGVAPNSPVDIEVAVCRGDGCEAWTVVVDGGDARTVVGADMAARYVEYAFALRLIQRRDRFVHVHAALVGTAERGLLLVGRSGVGKSTTSVALAQLGLTLYADDVALIERGTRRAVSFPRPIKLDDRSRALLGPMGLDVPSTVCLRESVARTALPGLASLDEPGPPVDRVICFANGRQTHPSLRPLTDAEAVMHLMGHSLTERLDGGRPSAEALRLVRAAWCCELTAGDLEETARLIFDLAHADGDLTKSTARSAALV